MSDDTTLPFMKVKHTKIIVILIIAASKAKLKWEVEVLTRRFYHVLNVYNYIIKYVVTYVNEPC